MEKHTNGALPLIKLQPLSPKELTQPRSSSNASFSVCSLINPSAPALASARFEPRGAPKTNLPFKSAFLQSPQARTTSVVTPPLGVGPLHIPIDVGTLGKSARSRVSAGT